MMKESNKPVKENNLQKSTGVRLNKYISNAGVCSRREADELIAAGDIKIDGKVMTDMGIKVMAGQTVTYKGKTLSTERKIYVLLNKPKDYVTTMDDPHADKKVIDLVKTACPERIYPVGRLDKNTTGLLLFTNDGELATGLSHPRYNKKKVYHVFLHRPVTKNDLQRLTDGIKIEADQKVAADAASFVDMDDKTQVGLEIHSGQNRVVRRMFEVLDYRVKKLDRVYYAGLTKKNLPRGKWRFLTENEIRNLKRGSYK